MRGPDLSGKGGATATSRNGANGASGRNNLTGRYLVAFRKGATDRAVELLRSAGYKVFVGNRFDTRIMTEDKIGDANVMVRPSIGTATIDAEPHQVAQLEEWARDPNSPIQAVKPEKIRHAPSTSLTTTDPSLVDHYREVLMDLVQRNKISPDKFQDTFVNANNELKATWGLRAINVVNSTLTGRGVKVAILDTGIDLEEDSYGNIQYHGDFAGRTITAISFVPDIPSAKDGNGHGTHCAGTACGPRGPSFSPSYGIAYEADICVVKVLNDEGVGVDGWIQDGIEWAVNQGCRVISMSFGAAKKLGDPFNEIYEAIAQRALDLGTVLIAAAGNESRRPLLTEPVNGPADCPSIIAVAAIDKDLDVAPFSNGGQDSTGREINVAAPGVDVFSSSLKGKHASESGTSMATPHVAGIAALLAQANPSATGQQLWNLLVRSVKSLPFGVKDVGSGLIQAPLAPETATASIKTSTPGEVGARQTSPITVGGGGSMGISFDTNRYKPVPPAPGQPTKFVNQVGDQIEKLRIIDKFGGAPDLTPKTVDCRVVVHSEDFDAQGNSIPNSDSPIVIHGNPLAVELKVEDFTFGVPTGSKNVMFFNTRRKLTGTVDVFEGAATQPTAQHELPLGGVCTVDVLNVI